MIRIMPDLPPLPPVPPPAPPWLPPPPLALLADIVVRSDVTGTPAGALHARILTVFLAGFLGCAVLVVRVLQRYGKGGGKLPWTRLVRRIIPRSAVAVGRGLQASACGTHNHARVSVEEESDDADDDGQRSDGESDIKSDVALNPSPVVRAVRCVRLVGPRADCPAAA